MEPFKEPSRKNSPSAKSLDQLMNLLMKLNDKLREKIAPSRAKKENGSGKTTDVVIIIISAQEEKSRPAKTFRPGKPEPLIPSPSPRCLGLDGTFPEPLIPSPG